MTLLSLGLTYFRRRPLLLFSSVAIGLGVAVLFTVLAVMNGFLVELEKSIRSFSGDAVIENRYLPSREPFRFADYQAALAQVDGVQRLEPRLGWYALVGRRGGHAVTDPRSTDLSGMMLFGVDDAFANAEGDGATATGGNGDGAVPIPMRLGRQAAQRLQLEIGDELGLITFVQGGDGRPAPLRATFRLHSLLRTGRFDQEMDTAHVPRAALANLLQRDPPFTQVLVRTTPDADPLQVAEDVETALKKAKLALPGYPRTLTWREKGGTLLKAVENQRGMLSIVFFFIVLVAAYQLVATLTLTVTEKRRDIGVLRALGATPGRIVRFFVALGMVVTVAGIGIGLVLGQWLTSNLRTVEKWISGGERIFRAEVYKFEDIPVSVDPASVTLLIAATLAAALVFSLVPALRAARLRIVDSLRKR